MTTPNTGAETPQPQGRFRLPDPPEREPDEKMTQFDSLFKYGNSHHLAVHLGNPETTLVEADRWLIAEPGSFRELARYPDLLVAFGVDPALYQENNGYIISEQGKPPDFVLEVASESTADTDVGAKRRDYAALGIPEYWRFDQTETGRYHGARLAGERLVEGEYEPIATDELPDGNLQGYSPALDMYLRWESGKLVFYNPATGQRVLTYEDQRDRADTAEARADTAEARAEAAEAERDAEREARAAAEARVRELEARISRGEA